MISDELPAAGLGATLESTRAPPLRISTLMLLEASGISRDRSGHNILNSARPVPDFESVPPPQPESRRIMSMISENSRFIIASLWLELNDVAVCMAIVI